MPDLNRSVLVESENADTLGGLTDVTIIGLAAGDFLKYNGTLWVNGPITLGTDTTGNYMSNVSAGNLISISHTPGEGSTATINVANGTAGQVPVANATGVPTYVTLSGDVTVNSSGVTSIGSGVIVNADINASAAIDKTKISGTAITAADTGTVTSTMIADGTIVNADISASAAIALSKLASGTSGQVPVANATGVPTYVTLSGDITIAANGQTTIAANSVALGTDTTGNYIATIAGTANEITVTGSGSESAAVTLSLPANVTIANNLTVTGDLTVNGNTTTLNTANLNVEDNFVLLNSGVTGSPSLNAGLEVERGDSTNVFIRWNETTDKWEFTTDGSTYTELGGGNVMTDTKNAALIIMDIGV